MWGEKCYVLLLRKKVIRMSRVGKQVIVLPEGVSINQAQGQLTCKGSLGTLAQETHPLIEISQEGSELTLSRKNDSKSAKAMHGTQRALLANMVQGVSNGFEKKLMLVGVGFRAQAQGGKLNLSLGFSHPVKYDLPDGVVAETPSQTEILVKGADKQKVGQVAAEIRSYRPPEPYKGKGVRYSDEVVLLKETKKK